MSSGKDLWDAAQQESDKGGVRSVNAMRFYALAKMLAEAETQWLSGNDQAAAERLRHLQAHCEKMIAALAPAAPCKPTLVSAA
jgi:hypothetical protein